MSAKRLTPAQAQTKLMRAAERAGYQTRPWNRPGRHGGWITRIYLRDAEDAEVGYIEVLVGRVSVRVNLDDREPDYQAHKAALDEIVAELVNAHGAPVAAATRRAAAS